MAISTDGNGNYLTLNQSGEWVKAQMSEDPRTGTKLIQDANGEWKPEPGKEPGVAGSVLRGIVRGVTFGFADELRAGTDALAQGVGNLIHGSDGRPTMSETYDRSLAANREQFRLDDMTNPASAIGGQIAGGVGGAIASRGAIPGAAITAMAPRLLNPLIANLPAWVSSGGRLILGGAAAGGAAGFGEGEGGLAPRLGTAAEGAATGAVVAPAVGAVTSAAPAVAGRVTHALGMRNAETAADRQILRSLERGGVTPQEAQTRLAAAGDQPVALVDVGGRNTVNLGATAANTPSKALDTADAFVESRRIGRPDRLTNASDEAFGGGSGTTLPETRADLREQRSAAGELYERSFKIQPTEDEFSRVSPWVNDRIGQEGMQRGLRVIELEHLAEGKEFSPKAFGVTRGEGGKFVPIEGQTPNMRLLDAVKRGYDEIVEDFRDKTSGRLNLDQYGRAVDANRRAYRDTLADMYHPYRRALQTWAGPSAQLDAIKAGETAFRTNRDVVADRMTRSADEQEAYRLGAGRDFSDRVSDPARASGAARKMLEDHQMQARLNSLLQDEVLGKFNDALRRETQMTAVERAVSPRANSQTARITAGGADMATDPSGPLMTAFRQVISGHPWQAAGTAGQDLYRRGQGINPATADALANRLFEVEPAARQRVTEALVNRLLQDHVATERARMIVRPVLSGLSRTAGGYVAQD
ncbi:MAG TPA: hypothetical protein VJV39_21875 [Dongiaceae bacterium]|nr:hypothetical protein [Dongiaceae bacterium]